MISIQERLRWLLIFSCLFFFTPSIFAQYDFLGRELGDELTHSIAVFCVDLDSDDDQDILGAARTADIITWWENEGDNAFTEHTLAENVDGATAVFAIDMDDDGDIDVLSAALTAGEITWWENDGDQDFTLHIISDTFLGASDVMALDLDDDDDIDVLGAGNSGNYIKWWENDGNQNFTEHLIIENYSGASAVHTADVNGDGYIDVIGCATGANSISWFENDQDQNFTQHQVTNAFDFAVDVYADDLDDDGDMDILGAAFRGDVIAWWENDGDENFLIQEISDDVRNPGSVLTSDIDGDDDPDVIGGIYGDGSILWWENDGDGDFIDRIITEDFSGAWGIYACDINDDDAIDIVGASFNMGAVWWWENNLIPHPDASVEGNVTDFETGDPVRFARVAFGLHEVVADRDGNYSIDEAYSISYDVRVTAQGFDTFIDDNVVLDAGENTYDVSMNYPASASWSRTSFVLNAEPYERDNISLYLRNSGGVNLDFDISETERWLSVDPDDGSIEPGDSIEIEIEGYARDLTDREIYYSTLIFETNDPANLYREMPVTFYVGYMPPDSFNLASPDSSYIYFEPEAELVWEAAIDSDSGEVVEYRLYITTDPEFLDDPFETGLTDTTYTFNAPNPITYYWTVFAVDRYLGGTWANNLWSFEIDPPEPPTHFSLLTPEDGDTISLSDPPEFTITWQRSVDPDPHEGAVYSVHLIVTENEGQLKTLDFSHWRDTLKVVNVVEEVNIKPWSECLQVEWFIKAFSGGDTTECDDHFTFYVEPASAVGFTPVSGIPTEYSIAAAYPNPFNPDLNIVIGLPETSDLDLKVYNIQGQLIKILANKNFQPGFHKFTFSGEGYSSGLYFIEAVVPNKMNEFNRVMLLK
ncbi:MAG: FG-GAP-like repeat-containing protein [Candidatus Electryonea clarkiae]|nr:FG-GAP-like repeat-containing protein [Candidatus Electryonea clarkiae]MDP8287434.1 FG-GAP-like repeat-containing protein [Candidatus Electryonea clarkiae]